MVKVQRTSEQIQHFLEEIHDQFWGDLVQHTKIAVKQFLDLWSERERDAFIGLARYQRYDQGGDERPSIATDTTNVTG